MNKKLPFYASYSMRSITKQSAPGTCRIGPLQARDVCGGHLAARPSPAPIRLLAILACGALLATMPAQGGWNILGQDPNEPRVDDGATFTVVSPSFDFVVDSSLDENKWWTSANPEPWTSVLEAPATGEHLGMRVDEAIPAGGSFWFGMSFEYRLNDFKHNFRIRYGKDGLAVPPDGTEIYLGYTNAGFPAGTDQGNLLDPQLGNAVVLGTGVVAPPASAFPANFVGSYSWLSFEQALAGNANNTNFVVQHIGQPKKPVSGMVVVIVLPNDETFPSFLDPADDPDNRMHFSWTIDGDRILGPRNPNFPDVLVPEPSRVILLGMAFALLVLRRSR